MKRIALMLFVIAVAAGVAGRAQTSPRTEVKSAPQSAKEVRGASPCLELEDEPAPKLIVDPPLPDLLDQGVVWIQWRAENVHIVPVFGKAPSLRLRESGICTSMSTICLGGGQTRATSTRRRGRDATWPAQDPDRHLPWLRGTSQRNAAKRPHDDLLAALVVSPCVGGETLRKCHGRFGLDPPR